VETFKLSTDPSFESKLRDVVGLYVNPPVVGQFEPEATRNIAETCCAGPVGSPVSAIGLASFVIR